MNGECENFTVTFSFRYGPLFRTSLVGRPVVISADPEFDYFIFQQEGKLVELWYLDSFEKLFGQDGSSNANGYIHKYLRKLILNHIGLESLKEKFLLIVEEMARQTLHTWSNQVLVEVKKATSTMIFDFTTKQLFGYEAEKSSESMSETFIMTS
ncbi:hypothetical protein HHK36_002844 [Tetracentron sinense]|uniref:Cytochrome P450 n=1 Tax=Tetracentron sinense TaxID=13715 RepID=A0A834ZX82_TETSI|nr:hypothetical protein HHK36_002844 [Tetracentron sinense]